MNPSQELIMQIVALNWGIAPPCSNVKEALDQMDPKDSKKMKRKYRKIKRKLLKSLVRKGCPVQKTNQFMNDLVIKEITREAISLLSPNKSH